MFALVTRLCLEPDLGVAALCRRPGPGEAKLSLLMPNGSLLLLFAPRLPEVDWLVTPSDRAADLLGMGVARVTVCRCEAGVGLGLAAAPASLGVTLGAAEDRFARVGICGC